jgi:hypothetical protein
MATILIQIHDREEIKFIEESNAHSLVLITLI